MSDKETRNEQENTHSHVSRNRRTLIKSAAAAAPVVLTLRSGAAAALASADTCIVRDQQIAQNTGPGVNGIRVVNNQGDTWVRTLTRCRTLQGTNSTGNTFQFRVYKDPTGSTTPANWYKANNENKIYRNSSPGKMINITNNKEFDIINTYDCNILVLFDQNGNVISFGRFNTSNGSDNDVGLPITNSCWASINP